MAKLIYFIPASLDGYIGDETIGYDWSVPDEEVFTFITDHLRPIGTFLYGRRMYETMAVWETPDVMPGLTPVMREFARTWQAAEKFVFSRSLATVSTGNTRLEREFDRQTIRDLKARSSQDLTVGGPNLAAHAIQAGLVDEYHLLVVPMTLGGGIRILPTGVSVKLELLGERRFASGWVYLRYRTRP
jgi:dihydrofolate reductase